MNLKISISKIVKNFIFFPLTHTVHLLTCGIEAAGDDDRRKISSFLASKAVRILISIK